MDNNYLSDDEEYVQNKNEVDKYGNFIIEYDHELVGCDFDDENINIDELDEEELKEYNEYLEYKKRENEIILNSLKKNTSLNLLSEEKPKNENKIKKEQKKKNTMDFSELNDYMDKVIESTKPKKFVSKRLLQKKGQTEDTNTNTKTIVIKKNQNQRAFKPRLPPYFHVNKK